MAASNQLLLETEIFRVEKHVQTVCDAAGRSTQLTRAIVVHPGSVVILPVVDERHLCLIRNHRIAVGKTLIELPAGTIEGSDAPLATAQRELQEETGYEAAIWRPLGGFYMSPGILSERIHCFEARDLTPGAAAREVGEEIENLIVDRNEALAMALDGRIEDAKTICTLLSWERRQQGNN